MSDEPEKRPTTISRDELYRQVWDSPASRLCEQYGISGRGLKKICDRLEIPCSPRGFWARLAAGQKVKRTPLTREWRDRDQSLEQQIGEIIAVLAIAPPILEKQRLEAEEQERRRWDAERKRQEAKGREDQDYNRWRRLIEFAKLWQEAKLAGNFLKALEQQPPEPKASYDGRTSSEWLD